MPRSITHFLQPLIKKGHTLISVPNSDPQAWNVRDEATGAIRPFKGAKLANALARLDRRNKLSMREWRVSFMHNRGKSIGETADELGVHWVTVVAIRARLHLPTKAPWGARLAWEEGRPFTGERKKRNGRPSPAKEEAVRLLGEGLIPAEIARRVGLSRQRVSRIRIEIQSGSAVS
jgi:DNA-binding NarL/FixJ family response regulator